jgi:hypothetical protein
VRRFGQLLCVGRGVILIYAGDRVALPITLEEHHSGARAMERRHGAVGGAVSWVQKCGSEAATVVAPKRRPCLGRAADSLPLSRLLPALYGVPVPSVRAARGP